MAEGTVVMITGAMLAVIAFLLLSLCGITTQILGVLTELRDQLKDDGVEEAISPLVNVETCAGVPSTQVTPQPLAVPREEPPPTFAKAPSAPALIHPLSDTFFDRETKES